MGREVRKVAQGWNHPKNKKGKFISLYKSSFREALQQWDENALMWNNGFYRISNHQNWMPLKPYQQRFKYRNFAGERPKNPNRYMPDWLEEEKICWQMYETASEGTPISPVMSSPEVLARWLTDNNASAFGSITANYKQWLDLIYDGNGLSSQLVVLRHESRVNNKALIPCSNSNLLLF